MRIEDIERGTVITFETTIGERHTNFKYVSQVPWYLAESLGVDVLALDSQYRPTMVSPAPPTFKDYDYLIFKNPQGDTVYFGAPWIKENSIEITGADSYILTISNPTERQMRSVRSMLVSLGLDNVKIDLIK